MDLSELILGLEDSWSILAIVLLSGPAVVMAEFATTKNCRYPVVRAILNPYTKGILLLVFEFLIIMYVIICFFASYFGKRGYVLFLLVMIAYGLAYLLLQKTSEQISQKIKNSLWYIIPIGILMLVTQYHEGADTWPKAFVFWREIVVKVLSYLFVAWDSCIVVAKRIWGYIACSVAVVVAIAVPAWRDICLYQKSKKNFDFSFIVEFPVVISLSVFNLWGHDWLNGYDSVIEINGKGFAWWAIIGFIVFPSLACYLSYRLQYLARNRKVTFNRSMTIALVVYLVIVFFQILFGLNFLAALRIFAIRGYRLVTGFVTNSVVWKTLVFKIGAAATFIQGLTAKASLAYLAIFLRQITFRLLIKLLVIALTWQFVASNKNIKTKINYWKEKLAEKGKEQGAKAKEFWDRFTFVIKFVVFAYATYFLYISYDLIWPLIPAGINKYCLKPIGMLISRIFKILTMPLKGLARNKTMEFFGVWVTKLLSKKVANLSPAVQHRFHMFLKWKVGKRVIKNKHRFIYFNKEFRKARRFKRLEEIEKEKGLLPGAIRGAGYTADTAVGLTLAAADFAKDGVFGTAKVAMETLGSSYNFADRKRIIIMAVSSAFFKEVFRKEGPPRIAVLQEQLMGMRALFRLKDPEEKSEAVLVNA